MDLREKLIEICGEFPPKNHEVLHTKFILNYVLARASPAGYCGGISRWWVKWLQENLGGGSMVLPFTTKGGYPLAVVHHRYVVYWDGTLQVEDMVTASTAIYEALGAPDTWTEEISAPQPNPREIYVKAVLAAARNATGNLLGAYPDTPYTCLGVRGDAGGEWEEAVAFPHPEESMKNTVLVRFPNHGFYHLHPTYAIWFPTAGDLTHRGDWAECLRQLEAHVYSRSNGKFRRFNKERMVWE